MDNKLFLNIAGYKFEPLDNLDELITTFQNTSLKKELLKITKDVEKKSTKGQNFDQSNNQANILEDDLTIIGLGK